MINVRFVCILLLSLLSRYESNGSQSSQLNEDLLNRLLSGLEKAYDFYESEYRHVNLDGVYGLRVSQGALLKILHDQQTGKLNLKESLVKRILKLEKRASKSADKSLPQLKQSNPLYFKKFETTVVQPWDNFKVFKKLDYSMYIPANKRSQISFDEDTSDACMTQMTGTGDQIKTPCQLSDQCWNLMTTKGTDGYTLTHQALFLLIGETKGCTKLLEEKLKLSKSKLNLKQVYDRICASMYPQMVEKEGTAFDSNTDRDLYMEQAMVCGMMGYYEFLSAARLKKILKWQKSRGCYGDNEEDDYKQTTIYDNAKKATLNGLSDEKLYDDLKGYDFKPGANSRKLTSMRTMRSLLVEKALNGGCMSHMTGVATGLLGVYLRWAVYLMYPVPTASQQQDNQHHMFMRKMMQNQPQLSVVKEISHQKETSNTTTFLLLLLLLFVLGHHLIARNVKAIVRLFVDIKRKSSVLGVYKKQHI